MEYIRFLFEIPDTNFSVCEICEEKDFLYVTNEECKHEYCLKCLKTAMKY